MRAANVGVIGYLLAALASISVPLAFIFATSLATNVFPQPDHQDLVQAIRAILAKHFSLH